MRFVARLTKATAAMKDVKQHFYQVCGSPICAHKEQTYEEHKQEDNGMYKTPRTPPWPPQEQDKECVEEVTIENDESKAIHDDKHDATPMLTLQNAKDAKIPYYLSEWYNQNQNENKKNSTTKDIDGAGTVPKQPRVIHGTGTARVMHQNIAVEELALEKVIGEGGFGKVYRAKWKGRRVAVKTLNCSKLSDAIVDDFEAELNIMSFLHHPNICQLLGAVFTPGHYALVVELVPRGSLWHVLHSASTRLSTTMRAKFIMDTARGMRYLHEFQSPILHRDMKSPNLLVEKDYSIKISDFGLARVKAHVQTMTGNCGTVQWMAPEVLASRKYTEKADVYSFGIVIWEIFTRKCPYDGMSPIQVALSVLNHNNRPPIPSPCPRFFTRLMRLCWMKEPERRPSFAQIINTYERLFGGTSHVQHHWR